MKPKGSMKLYLSPVLTAYALLLHGGTARAEGENVNETMKAAVDSTKQGENAQIARGGVWTAASVSCGALCASSSGSYSCVAESILGELSQGLIEKKLGSSLQSTATKLATSGITSGINGGGKNLITTLGKKKAAEKAGEKVSKQGAKKASEKIGCVVETASMSYTATTSFLASNQFKNHGTELEKKRTQLFENEGNKHNPFAYNSQENETPTRMNITQSGPQDGDSSHPENGSKNKDFSKTNQNTSKSPCTDTSTPSNFYRCASSSDPLLAKAYPEKQFVKDLNNMLGNRVGDFLKNPPRSTEDAMKSLTQGASANLRDALKDITKQSADLARSNYKSGSGMAIAKAGKSGTQAGLSDLNLDSGVDPSLQALLDQQKKLLEEAQAGLGETSQTSEPSILEQELANRTPAQEDETASDISSSPESLFIRVHRVYQRAFHQ